MTEWENKVAEFFLSISDDDDAEERTCRRFNITQDTLNYILHCHLHESFCL